MLNPKTQTSMSWKYVNGLIETDGSFAVNLASGTGQPKPMIKITQRTNSNLLPEIKSFLARHGINSTIEPGQTTGKKRAPALRIQGRNQVKLMIGFLELNALVKDGNLSVVFASAKQRDLLITKAFCVLTNLNTAEKIALLKSFRKSSADLEDLELPGMKSRKEYEKMFDLTPGASLNAAKSLLNQIDQTYLKGVNTIKNGIKTGSLKVDPLYITALIDGDGGYSISVFFQKAKEGESPNPTVVWMGLATMTMEPNALLTLKVFVYYFNISKFSLEKGYDMSKTNVTSYQIWVRAQDAVLRIINHHQKYPPLGNYRKQQFNLLKTLFQLRADNKLKDYNVAANFLKEVYAVAEISSKGPKRRPLDETLNKLKELLPRPEKPE